MMLKYINADTAPRAMAKSINFLRLAGVILGGCVVTFSKPRLVETGVPSER